MSERGTLKLGEPHPAAWAARDWLSSLPLTKLLSYQGPLASCAIEDNGLAEICSETLRRLLNHEPVSDRYLLGLAWTIRSMEDGDEQESTGDTSTHG